MNRYVLFVHRHRDDRHAPFARVGFAATADGELPTEQQASTSEDWETRRHGPFGSVDELVEYARRECAEAIDYEQLERVATRMPDRETPVSAPVQTDQEDEGEEKSELEKFKEANERAQKFTSPGASPGRASPYTSSEAKIYVVVLIGLGLLALWFFGSFLPGKFAF